MIKRNKVVGYGWTGLYCDGEPGWLLSQFISHGDREPLDADQLKALRVIANDDFATSDMYRVKVTIELVKNKRGRYIVKRAKRSK